MQVGKLNRRIVIERQQVTEDPLGGQIVAWLTLATLWSNFRNMSGTEAIKSDAQIGTTKTSVRIRYREDIDQTCRLLHRGLIYEIESVLPDEQGREYVDLVVSTGASNG